MPAFSDAEIREIGEKLAKNGSVEIVGTNDKAFLLYLNDGKPHMTGLYSTSAKPRLMPEIKELPLLSRLTKRLAADQDSILRSMREYAALTEKQKPDYPLASEIESEQQILAYQARGFKINTSEELEQITEQRRKVALGGLMLLARM